VAAEVAHIFSLAAELTVECTGLVDKPDISLDTLELAILEQLELVMVIYSHKLEAVSQVTALVEPDIELVLIFELVPKGK